MHIGRMGEVRFIHEKDFNRLEIGTQVHKSWTSETSTIYRICFNLYYYSHEPGVAKVEIEGLDGDVIRSTVHLTTIQSRGGIPRVFLGLRSGGSALRSRLEFPSSADHLLAPLITLDFGCRSMAR